MSEDKLLEAFRRLIKGVAPGAFIGLVRSVDEQTMVAEVEHDELIYDVLLKAVADEQEQQFVLVPAVESYVVACPIDGDKERCVLLISSVVDKVIYQGKNTSLVIDDQSGKIIFNNAEKESFMTDINQLVSQMNTIEQDLNTLKSLFKSWTPAAMDGGAALKVATQNWAATDIEETTVEAIKDDKIEH